MNPQRFSWTEPALCHYGHDLTKDWFVYFSFTDHYSSQTKRKQCRAGINRAKTKDARIKYGNAVISYWKKKLESGYNAFIKDDSHKMPFDYCTGEAFEKILKIKLPTLKKRAKETYSFVCSTFIAWLNKEKYYDIPMSKFSAASEYMDYLISEKNYAGRTHNDHLIILKVFINAMIEREWILKNPFKKVKKREVSIGRNLAYSDQEKQSLKDHLYRADREMYYFSQIMYYCFIRRSELALLKIGDVDLINYTITIPAGVSKNKSQESVVIPVGLEPILKEMKLSQYDKNDYLFGSCLMRSPHQFKNHNHISTRHNKHLKGLGIDNQKGLYSWKHSGVCAAYYATGKDIYAVMRQLRHRDLNTTQIYLKSLGLIQNDVFRMAMIA
jgi:integrase/recombinase XerD